MSAANRQRQNQSNKKGSLPPEDSGPPLLSPADDPGGRIPPQLIKIRTATGWITHASGQPVNSHSGQPARAGPSAVGTTRATTPASGASNTVSGRAANGSGAAGRRADSAASTIGSGTAGAAGRADPGGGADMEEGPPPLISDDDDESGSTTSGEEGSEEGISDDEYDSEEDYYDYDGDDDDDEHDTDGIDDDYDSEADSNGNGFVCKMPNRGAQVYNSARDPSAPAVPSAAAAAAVTVRTPPAGSAPIEEVSNDEDDPGSSEGYPDLVTSDEEAYGITKSKPFRAAAAQAPAPAPTAKAANLNASGTTLKKGFFLQKKEEPARPARASVTSPGPSRSPQSLQTPRTERASMPYSNAGVGVRESIRPEGPVRSKAQAPASSRPSAAARSTSTAASVAQPAKASPSRTSGSESDDEMPPLVECEGEENLPGGGSGRGGGAHRVAARSGAGVTGTAGAAAAAPAPAQPNAPGRKGIPNPDAKAEPAQEKTSKRSKVRKEKEAPAAAAAGSREGAPMTRTDFANDDAWQQHLAREREERERLRRERGLVEDDGAAAAADSVLGYCCLRPGNDTDHVCDEPRYQVKESQRRYLLQCTRGCSMLFHDKCWRPFADGMAQLRGDEFDRNFKDHTREGKPKLHRCVTDSCDGHICRVVIFTAGSVGGTDPKPAHELYSMDATARQLAAVAEATKRRKRPPGDVDGQASASGSAPIGQQAAKKTRKGGAAAKAAATATAAAAGSSSARVGSRTREERRRAAEAVAAAAARGPENGQEAPAQPTRPAAPRGISIVNRKRDVPKVEESLWMPREDEAAAALLPEAEWAAATAPPPSASESTTLHPPAASPMPDEGDADTAGAAAGPSAAAPPAAAVPAASAAAITGGGGGGKKKMKGTKMHLDEFNSVGTTAVTAPGVTAAATAAAAAAARVPVPVPFLAAPPPPPPPQPPVQICDFPTLYIANEQRARPSDIHQADYVLEALMKLKYDERLGGHTNVLLLDGLDVRWIERNHSDSEKFLREYVSGYGPVLRQRVFRDQECAAVEMEKLEDASKLLFSRPRIGNRPVVTCYLREFPTDEVLSRQMMPVDEEGYASDSQFPMDDFWPSAAAEAEAAAVAAMTAQPPPKPPRPHPSPAGRIPRGAAAPATSDAFGAAPPGAFGEALSAGLYQSGSPSRRASLGTSGGLFVFEGAGVQSRDDVAPPPAGSSPLQGSRAAPTPPGKKTLTIIDPDTGLPVHIGQTGSSSAGSSWSGNQAVGKMAAAVFGSPADQPPSQPDMDADQERAALHGEGEAHVDGSQVEQQAHKLQGDESTTAGIEDQPEVGAPVNAVAELGAAASGPEESVMRAGGKEGTQVAPSEVATADLPTAQSEAGPSHSAGPEPAGSGGLEPQEAARPAVEGTAAAAANAAATAPLAGAPTARDAGPAEATTAAPAQPQAVQAEGTRAPAPPGADGAQGAPGPAVQEALPDGGAAPLPLSATVTRPTEPQHPERDTAPPVETTPRVQAGPEAPTAASSTPGRGTETPPVDSMTSAPLQGRTSGTLAGQPANEASRQANVPGLAASEEGAAAPTASASAVGPSAGPVAGPVAATAASNLVAAPGAAPAPRGPSLTQLIAAGAPAALSLTTVASRGGVAPPAIYPAPVAVAPSVITGTATAIPVLPVVRPFSVAVDSFWQDYDVVYIITSETKHVATYLENAVNVPAAVFPDWNAAVPLPRVAALLYNRDTAEVLGLWGAQARAEDCVTLQLVRRLPPMSRESFVATPAGGRVLSNLTMDKLSVRAQWQDARDVLRVLAEHEAEIVAKLALTAEPRGALAVPSVGGFRPLAYPISAGQVQQPVVGPFTPSAAVVSASTVMQQPVPPVPHVAPSAQATPMPQNLLNRLMRSASPGVAAPPGTAPPVGAAVPPSASAAAAPTATPVVRVGPGAAAAPPPPGPPPPPPTAYWPPVMAFMQQRAAPSAAAAGTQAAAAAPSGVPPPAPGGAAQAAPVVPPTAPAPAAPVVIPPTPATGAPHSRPGPIVRPFGVPPTGTQGLPRPVPAASMAGVRPMTGPIRPAQHTGVQLPYRPAVPGAIRPPPHPVVVAPASVRAAAPGSGPVPGPYAAVPLQTTAGPAALQPVQPVAAPAEPPPKVPTPPPAPQPPRQPPALLCAMCVQNKGSWFLLGCKHMGPCSECCSDEGKLRELYPVCWCGAAIESQKVHKAILA